MVAGDGEVANRLPSGSDSSEQVQRFIESMCVGGSYERGGKAVEGAGEFGEEAK